MAELQCLQHFGRPKPLVFLGIHISRADNATRSHTTLCLRYKVTHVQYWAFTFTDDIVEFTLMPFSTLLYKQTEDGLRP